MNNMPDKLVRVAENLARNNMQVIYAADRAQALQAVKSLLQPGNTIGLGGSVTLQECGITELVRNPEYRLIDRYQPGMTPEQMEAKFAEALTADVFLCSTNAITEDGILVNIDGNSNRVAAIAYGPTHVIMVVGMNKVAKDLDAAMSRARNVAAPINAQRFDLDTPCKKNGSCANCMSKDTICCQFLVTRFSRHEGRIKVILVGEDLGF